MESSQIKDWTCVFYICRQILNHWTTGEAPHWVFNEENLALLYSGARSLFCLPAQLCLLSSLVFNSSQELGSRGHLSISFWKNVLQGTSLKLLGKRPSVNAGVRCLFSPLADTTWPLLPLRQRGQHLRGWKGQNLSLCAVIWSGPPPLAVLWSSTGKGGDR